MFILMPTCDTHAGVSEISAALLARYWPAHPPLHVLHYDRQPRISGAHLHYAGTQPENPWRLTLTRFLRECTEEVFLLLLDDYALCGPPRAQVIEQAHDLLARDSRVGLFPLCWYPAQARAPRPLWPGIVTLSGAPVLLQAALWRREAFLALAERMPPQSSPWGFEAMATQLLKAMPMEICCADIPEPPFVGGPLVDGFAKATWPLPYHNLMRRGLRDERHDAFLRAEGFPVPSRGLGDTVARITHALGIDRLAGPSCGCHRRREKLNEWVPYRS